MMSDLVQTANLAWSEYCVRHARAGVVLALVGSGLLPVVGSGPASAASRWEKIAVWHMDETSGTRMRDSVGNNHGKLHFVRLGRVGFKGGAYGFNGTSSYVDVPNADVFNFGVSSVRVTVHIRTSVLGHSTAGDDLIKKGYYASSPGLFKMEIYPDGKVSCAFKGPKGYTGDIFSRSSVVTLPPATPVYHTVRCVLDQARKQAAVVVDGVAEGTRRADVGSITSRDPVLIGAYPGTGFYNGVLDEVMIEVRQP